MGNQMNLQLLLVAVANFENIGIGSDLRRFIECIRGTHLVPLASLCTAVDLFCVNEKDGLMDRCPKIKIDTYFAFGHDYSDSARS